MGTKKRAVGVEKTASDAFRPTGVNRATYKNTKVPKAKGEGLRPRIADKLRSADQKRTADARIMKNRGLTAYKKKGKNVPRAKRRAQFEKADQKRKAKVKSFLEAQHANYGGEAYGINPSVVHSTVIH